MFIASLVGDIIRGMIYIQGPLDHVTLSAFRMLVTNNSGIVTKMADFVGDLKSFCRNRTSVFTAT